MYVFNAHRIRLILIVAVVILIWQIFRNWPSEDKQKWVKIAAEFLLHSQILLKL